MGKNALVTTVFMAIICTQLLLPGCKRSESPAAKTTPGQAHQKEMLTRGFADSKKVTAVNVNGVAITEFFVLREMNAAAPQYLASGQKRTRELDAKIRRDAINILITQELAVQEAKRRGIPIPAAVVDDELRRIRSQAGSESAFRDYLASNGLTGEELRKIIESDFLFEQIASLEIDRKIDTSDAALKALYEREKAGMKDAAHRQMTFEEARGMLEQRLRTEESEKRLKAWEKELRKNASIEIFGQ
jgi:hypothetical protein